MPRPYLPEAAPRSGTGAQRQAPVRRRTWAPDHTASTALTLCHYTFFSIALVVCMADARPGRGAVSPAERERRGRGAGAGRARAGWVSVGPHLALRRAGEPREHSDGCPRPKRNRETEGGRARRFSPYPSPTNCPTLSPMPSTNGRNSSAPVVPHFLLHTLRHVWVNWMRRCAWPNCGERGPWLICWTPHGR